MPHWPVLWQVEGVVYRSIVIYRGSTTFLRRYPRPTPRALVMMRICSLIAAVGSLFCVTAANAADTTVHDGKLIEDWSMNNWKTMIGDSYSTADISNDKLARFPDGYPVRLADVDFTVRNENATFYGHSGFAFSVRGARYGYVNCAMMGGSAEQVARMWALLADKAERVVNSFVLGSP